MIEQLILIMISTIINGWIIYYITYFKKKGEYQVLKEDIEEITEKVETIKTQFAIHAGKLQAEREFYNQNRLSINSEERNSILNFVDKYSIWLNAVLSFSTNNPTDESRLEIVNNFDKAKAEFEVADSRLELFIQNEELRTLKTNLKIKTIEIAGNSSKCITAINYVYKKAETYKDRIPLGTFDSDEYGKILGETNKLIEKNNLENIQIYRELIPIEYRIKEFLRNKLREILDRPDE